MTQRVAIVGCGFMGRVHAASYYKGNLDAEVAYVVGCTEEESGALAASLPAGVRAVTDVQVALDDPAVEILDICVPTAAHGELVMRAAAAGKHVLCEKPIAPTVEEADRMIAACAERGVHFMVAHVLRFWPEYAEAARLVKDGCIGAIRHVDCLRLSASPGWSVNNWMLNVRESGGAVRDLAIHDFDFLHWVCGLPQEIRAMGEPMHFDALLRFASGVTAHVQASYIMPAGFPFRMAFRLFGERGVLEFDGTGGALTLATAAGMETLPVAGSRTFRQDGSEDAVDGYFHEIAYFLECVARNVSPERACPQAARDALATALAVEAALKANLVQVRG